MAANREKITFTNNEGLQLAGLLEKPSGDACGYVLFAHCFTCGKDIAAATRIGRALAEKGYATLRFDFTGLGSSDGDFANTNFSSNVDDLIAAADFLRENYAAPVLLIGHSLGGAAVLSAAGRIDECKAVATIGAPSDPGHVAHQFGCDIDTIRDQGVAEVSLAGRPFTIKKQFLEDIESNKLKQDIENLNKALLVFHSPIDATVSVNEAASIYAAAKHPKSFVSLDKADHLLTKKEDAEYVADTITAWIARYLPREGKDNIASPKSGSVLIQERNKQFLRDVITDDHFFQVDEPIKAGGSNVGPDPYELLLASLGACTSMTIRMYANHKQWDLKYVDVTLSHSREHSKDCTHCEEQSQQIDVIDRSISFTGDLNESQIKRLLEIADKCPVHKTLHNTIDVRTKLVG